MPASSTYICSNHTVLGGGRSHIVPNKDLYFLKSTSVEAPPSIFIEQSSHSQVDTGRSFIIEHFFPLSGWSAFFSSLEGEKELPDEDDGSFCCVTSTVSDFLGSDLLVSYYNSVAQRLMKYTVEVRTYSNNFACTNI